MHSGCNSTEVEPGERDQKKGVTLGDDGPATPCGESYIAEGVDENREDFGKFEIANDAQFLWTMYELPAGANVTEGKMYIGKIESLPLEADGSPAMKAFQFNLEGSEGSTWFAKTSLSKVPECYVISLRLKLSLESGEEVYVWPKGRPAGNGFYVEACLQECNSRSLACDNGAGVGEFTTYSAEQWVNGKAASTLSAARMKAFPEGVIRIGCEEMYRGEISADPAELKARFATSGEPNMLTGEMPEGAIANPLFWEVFALTVNVAVDDKQEDFGKSAGRIARLRVTSGPFAGWTVEDILREAHWVIGGCASNYSPQQMLEVISRINQNFLEGKKSDGFLEC